MSNPTIDEFEQRVAAFLEQPRNEPPPKPLDPLVPYFLKFLSMSRARGKYRVEARQIAGALDTAGVDWGKDWNRLREVGTRVLHLKELQAFPTWWIMNGPLPQVIDGVLVFPQSAPPRLDAEDAV